MISKKTLVILAGGLGSRYKGLKQTDAMSENGATIMEYSIYDALEAGFNKFVIVINKLVSEEFKTKINSVFKEKNAEVFWCVQSAESFVPVDFDVSEREKPWGTGHALLCAKNVVQENFFMINADDFYGKEIYQLASELTETEINEKTAVQIAFPLGKTLSESGSVSRGLCALNEKKELVSIDEKTKIFITENTIFHEDEHEKLEMRPYDLVSMNFWGFNPEIFNDFEQYFHDFLTANLKNNEEFFIPTVIQNLINEGKITVKVETSPSEWKGVTYPTDKMKLQKFLQTETAKNRYPVNLWN